MGGVKDHHAIRRPPSTGSPSTGAGYVPDKRYLQLVRAHGKRPRGEPNLFVLLCSLFSDGLGLPRAAYVDFPRPREWEAAVGRYRALFTAFGIRSQDVLLRLTNRRLYIGPQVQECLAGLDAEWEELLTRLTRGSKCAGGGSRASSFSGGGGPLAERIRAGA